MKLLFKKIFSLKSILSFLLILVSKTILAAFIEWSGSFSDDWATSRNWVIAVVPTAGDIAAFTGNPRSLVNPHPVNRFVMPGWLDSIDFSYATGAYTITNSGHMYLQNGITNTSGILHTINNTVDSYLSIDGPLGENLQIKNAGTLIFTGSTNSLWLTTNINNKGGITVFRTNSGIVTFAGDITGGTLEKMSRDGELILTGHNEFDSIMIATNGGYVAVGDGVANASLCSDVIYIGPGNAGIIFNDPGNITYNGIINGFGSLTQRGTGQLTLTADHTYGGDTSIERGSLSLGDGTANTGSVLSRAIRNNGTLIYNHLNGQFVENSRIIGEGRVIKNGNDTLIFIANNFYSGDTVVNAGALQIGDNSSGTGFVRGPIQVSSGASVIFNRPDKIIYEDVISGSGNVIKKGSGTLVLDGVNTYNGTTFVKSGTLLIGGDEAHSDAQVIGDIVVMPGATLGGHGYFNSNIVNDGSLAPAASIGITSIHGNYTQNSDGNLVIELDSQGRSDLLSVDGKIKIAGNLVVNTDAGFIASFPYTFIRAETIEGQFDNVDQSGRLNQGFLSAQVSIENRQVSLVPDFNKSVMLAASNTPNRLAVTSNILSTKGTPAVQAMIGKAKNTSDFARATDQLSGATYANQTLQLAQTAKWLDRQLYNQIDKSDGFWIFPYGSMSKLGANSSSGLNTDMSGLGLGINKHRGETIQWGVAFASSYFDSDATGNEIANDYGTLYQLGIYVDYHYHNWIIDTHFTAGTTDAVNAKRTVGGNTTNASYIDNVFSQQIKAGYKLLSDKNYFFPFVGLLMQQVNRNSFSETGEDGIALDLKPSNYQSLQSQLGVSMAIPLNYADWTTSVAWQHQFEDTQATLDTQSGLHINGVDMGSDSLEVSTGFKIAASKKFDLCFLYQGYFAQNYVENGVKIQLTF